MKYDRFEKTLKCAFYKLYMVMKKHREQCHEWAYPPKIKMALTNCQKTLVKCDNSLTGKVHITGEDMNKFLKRMDSYNTFYLCKKEDKDINDYMDQFSSEYLIEICQIYKIVEYIDSNLTITVSKYCPKEYIHFHKWYMHFHNFLHEEIFKRREKI